MAEPGQYGERGGSTFQNHNAHGSHTMTEGFPSSDTSFSNATSIADHDWRFPRRPGQSNGTVSSAFETQKADSELNSDTNQTPLDPLILESKARKDLMRETFFPTWKDDASGVEDPLDSPDEMQKKDPLATQIWRLYSKTKKQLPNQERMENLTWRMMAMNLRKRKQEETAR